MTTDELEPGWNGEPGAPKDPPPDDVVTEDGEPIWTDTPNGPEWVTSDAASLDIDQSSNSPIPLTREQRRAFEDAAGG